jgi:hypothetical protein
VHTLSSAFVLGYHGCDTAVAEKLLAGGDFAVSTNDYDWLGDGVYFWEANPRRGLDYAQELAGLKRGPKINQPTVIGAVLDLGLCLDLTTSAGLNQVRVAYSRLRDIHVVAEINLPENSPDNLRRNLDCAVIGLLHTMRENENLPRIDSVKGIFVEGSPIYPGAGFHDKTHSQICVRNADCIKGVFRVPNRFIR